MLRRSFAGSAAPGANRSGIPPAPRHAGAPGRGAGGARALADAGFAVDANLLPSLAILAEAAALLDDPAAAAMLHACLLAYRGRNIVDGRATYCYGSADLHLGMLAGAVGRWTDALDHLADALAFHRRIGARPHLCRTLCAAAHVEWSRGAEGDARSAGALAAEAIDVARALATPELLRRATEVAERVPGSRRSRG